MSISFRYLKGQLNAGFSLVEVTIALGIAAFAIVPLIALVPMGLSAVQNAGAEGEVVNLLNAVVADRHTTPITQPSIRYGIPPLTETLTTPVSNDFLLSDAGTVVQDVARASYRIRYTITPPMTGKTEPYIIHYRASWPAGSTGNASFLEIVTAISSL